MLTLAPVTAGNWRAALALEVTADQLAFVADHQPVAAVALAKAYVGAAGHAWTPLLMLRGATPVGFLALTHRPVDPGHIWLFHFFVDHRHQRRGHARAAMEAVIALLRTRTPLPVASASWSTRPTLPPGRSTAAAACSPPAPRPRATWC